MKQFWKKKNWKWTQRFCREEFRKSSNCRNTDQIRFYVRDYAWKLKSTKSRFNFVPGTAYFLLAQYNMCKIPIRIEFKRRTVSILWGMSPPLLRLNTTLYTAPRPTNQGGCSITDQARFKQAQDQPDGVYQSYNETPSSLCFRCSNQARRRFSAWVLYLR